MWSYDGRDMIISSNNVISFPNQQREWCRMTSGQYSMVIYYTDEGGKDLYKKWNSGRTNSYEKCLKEYLVRLTQSEGFGVVV